MKIVIEENIREDKYILQVGDIVECQEDDFYVVTHQLDENKMRYNYILWSLNGDQGYDGYYNTLEELTNSLVDDERIFKASEYELRLIRKERSVINENN